MHSPGGAICHDVIMAAEHTLNIAFVSYAIHVASMYNVLYVTVCRPLIAASLCTWYMQQLMASVMWCVAREEEKMNVKKQNEALIAERKCLEQRAAQLAESLVVSGCPLIVLQCSWSYCLVLCKMMMIIITHLFNQLFNECNECHSVYCYYSIIILCLFNINTNV